MRNKKPATITAQQVNYIMAHGVSDIYNAYEKPSYNKVRAFNYWREYCAKRHLKNMVIYGHNCNYFTLYAIDEKRSILVKITYANIYEYNII